MRLIQLNFSLFQWCCAYAAKKKIIFFNYLIWSRYSYLIFSFEVDIEKFCRIKVFFYWGYTKDQSNMALCYSLCYLVLVPYNFHMMKMPYKELIFQRRNMSSPPWMVWYIGTHYPICKLLTIPKITTFKWLIMIYWRIWKRLG